MFNCLKLDIKKIILIIVIILLLFPINLIHADDSFTINSKTKGEKNIVKPQKILLVKINPKIDDNEKFLQSLDSLFVDNLNLNQNIFSYFAIDNKIYKLRDLDIDYTSNDSEGKIVYIGYTKDIPLQLISNLISIYNIKQVLKGNLSFQKNLFNISEEQITIPTLPIPNIDYSLSDPQIELDSKIQPASIIDLKVKFKNNSIYPILKSDPSKVILVSIDKGKESPSDFFLNNSWYSNSRVGTVINDRIGSGETGEISLKILTQAMAGKQKQSFALANADGKIYTGTEFQLEVEIPDNGQKIVEIKNNGYGFQNIRDSKKSNARVIGFANQGTKLLSLESDNIWVKVKFEGNIEGWIPLGYVKKLN